MNICPLIMNKDSERQTLQRFSLNLRRYGKLQFDNIMHFSYIPWIFSYPTGFGPEPMINSICLRGTCIFLFFIPVIQ